MLTPPPQTAPRQTHYDVIVAGGGPVGTSLAYDLARRGVSCLLIDYKIPGAKKFKAGSCNIRTMEHIRRIGVAEAVKAAFPIVPEHDLDVVFATGLRGYELHRFKHCLGWGANTFSPERTRLIPQRFMAETLQREAAAAFPRFECIDGWRVTQVTQDERVATVSAVHVRSEQAMSVSATYVVGCDGGSSTVRGCIGSVLEGTGARAGNVSIMFNAPELPRQLGLRHAQQFWLVNDQVNAYILWGSGYQLDDDNEFIVWYTTPEIESQIRSDPASFVYKAIGFEFPLSITSIDPWKTHELVADTWRVGRVFLAGDASHLHPPTGGLGMNTGVGDAMDLSWKLAAQLQGWGGPSLLDSYEMERRSLARRVVAQANHNYDSGSPADYWEPGIDEPGPAGDAIRKRVGEKIFKDKNDEFNAPGLVLGYGYPDSPVIVDDGSSLPLETVVEYRPTSRPGWRLPHSVDASGTPLFDRLGHGFSLVVVGPGQAADTERFARHAAGLGVPLNVVPVEAAHGALYEKTYLLVRPDQHVAWRGDSIPADPRAVLREVTGRAVAAAKGR